MNKINLNKSKFEKMALPVLLTSRKLNDLEHAIDMQIDKLDRVCDLNNIFPSTSKLRDYTVNEIITASRFLYRLRDITQDAIQVHLHIDYTKDRYAIDGHKVMGLACGVDPELLGLKICGFINRM